MSAVEAGGVGKGGDININAANLTMRDGGQLIAMIREADNNTVAGKGSAEPLFHKDNHYYLIQLPRLNTFCRHALIHYKCYQI